MSDRARVLVADDEASIRFVLRETLEAAGHEVVEVGERRRGARGARQRGPSTSPSSTSACPGPRGSSCSSRCARSGSDVAVVIITAQNTFENAVEAMKRGALDYLVKPFGMDAVQALVEKVLRTRALERELRSAAPRGRPPDRARATASSAGAARSSRSSRPSGASRASDVAVLITGESGTGKELVARAIHQASARAEEPFVAVNCAAIPRELLESELFGHERGAFTGAIERAPGRFREARGGTLFLDEIGDMPLELQAKLLRVLQSGEVTSVGGRQPEHVDVRIIAATHRDLDAAVRDGPLPRGPLYRLRVVPIEIPPLRERREDVAALAQHFVARYADELGDRPAHALAGRARSGCSRTPGRATSASSRTRSSARSCSRRARC